MSYLTQSYEELQTLVIAALETETGLTFNENTETITEFYSRCLGENSAWLTKSEGRLLAELNSAMGGSSISHLRFSYARLLDTLSETIGGAGGGYQASAVHLDGASYLSAASLTAPGDDTGYFSASFWWKIASPVAGQLWTVDPVGNYTSNQYFSSGATQKTIIYATDDAFSSNLQCQVDSTLNGVNIGDDEWHNVKVNISTNHAAGNKICAIYVADTLASSVISDSGAAFLMHFNGAPFYFGDDSYGNFVTGDFADVWIAPGQFVDFSVEANRRKFIDANGKPVDLGADGSTPTGIAPAVFFSGNASSFATNKGTGGAFSLTGSLTNASTSPSD